MNTVIITGNLTRDVETRFTPNGTAIGNVNIACNRKWKDPSGELKEEVSFFGVVIFGKQAETVAQYFKKGSPILILGRLKQESWSDKQTGEKKSKTVIVMESFEFMSGKRDGAPSSPAPSTPRPSTPAPKATADEEDDVPFRTPIPVQQLRNFGLPTVNKVA
jgi:single-strand DNA-binding protein